MLPVPVAAQAQLFFNPVVLELAPDPNMVVRDEPFRIAVRM